MNIRRVCSLLCALSCAGMLMLGTGNQSGAAQDKDRELLPVADAMIVDQSPFDGLGDGVAEDVNAVFLNDGIAEGRVTMVFDLGKINPKRIESATLRIVSTGTGILPGTLTIPVEVHGDVGDGPIQNDDFSAGSTIAVFDSLATPDNVPKLIDVTEFVQGIHPPNQRTLRFTLRTDVHGVTITYGSLELGPVAALVVKLK